MELIQLQPLSVGDHIPGGSFGGGSAATPHESDDTLRSESFFTILDGLGEGEWVGLCDRNWNPITDPKHYGKGIFLNEIPLTNDDGTVNFERVYVAQVFGTQSQSYIPGASTVGNTVSDGRQLSYNQPRSFVIDVTENDCDRVIIGLQFPSLTKQDKAGNIKGISPSKAVRIQIEIQLKENPSFISQIVSIDGKSSSEYVRDVLVTLPRSSDPESDYWLITLTRLTVDSTSVRLHNSSYISYRTTLTDEKFRYPHTAAIMLHADAKQFTNVPQRGYRVKMLKVRVPGNYFPETRKYTRSAHGGGGFSVGDDTHTEQDWDGTFYVAWTDNPAWCFYDLLTNDRYGLGESIAVDNVDIWSLYTIGRYCDELLDDGFGGLEPRYTCNTYIQEKAEAYRVLTDMASTFRGMLYYGAGTIVPVQDSPKDPFVVFTNASVEDGLFTYTGTEKRKRHPVVHVSYNDPDDFYKPKPVNVTDVDGLIRYGPQEMTVNGFGVTSRGVAHRLGLWAIATELYEPDVVTFNADMTARKLRPGDIFTVFDQFRAGVRNGGRVIGISSDRLQIILDSVVRVPFSPIRDNGTFFCTPTQGSKTVLAASGQSWKQIKAGAIFHVPDKPSYMVEKDAYVVGGRWAVDLTVPYGEATLGLNAFTLSPCSLTLVTPTAIRPPSEDIGSSVSIPTVRPSQLSILGVDNDAGINVSAIQLSAPAPADVIVGSLWALQTPVLSPQYFRTMGVSEVAPYKYQVTGITFNRSKFGAIEKGLAFVTPTFSVLPQLGTVLKPNNLKASIINVSRPEGIVRAVHLTWTKPPDINIIKYGVAVRYNHANWEFVGETGSTYIDHVVGTQVGYFEFQVYSINIASTHSPSADVVITVPNITPSRLFKVSGLEIRGQGHNVVYNTKDVKFDWKLNSLTNYQEFGSGNWGADSGSIDSTFDCFEVSIFTATTRILVHFTTVQVPSYTLTFAKNIQYFGTSTDTYIIQVAGRDKYNNLTNSVRIQVNSVASAAPSSRTLASSFGHVTVQWKNPTDSDHSHVELWEGKLNTDMANNLAVIKARIATPAHQVTKGGYVAGNQRYFFWLKSVDVWKKMSTAGYAGTAIPGLISPGDIDITVVDVVISPNGGNITGAKTVKMTCATPNSKIYYRLNTGTPTILDTLYTGPITVSTTSDVSAAAFLLTERSANVAHVHFVLAAPGGPEIETPEFTEPPKTYYTLDGTKKIHITCDTPGVSIRVTDTGIAPTPSVGTVVGAEGFVIDSGYTTLKAIAYIGANVSDVATGVYRIELNAGGDDGGIGGDGPGGDGPGTPSIGSGDGGILH